jgi:hypothetical protein
MVPMLTASTRKAVIRPVKIPNLQPWKCPSSRRGSWLELVSLFSEDVKSTVEFLLINGFSMTADIAANIQGIIQAYAVKESQGHDMYWIFMGSREDFSMSYFLSICRIRWEIGKETVPQRHLAKFSPSC